MKIYNKAQISAVINLARDFPELLRQQSQAFTDYSNGKTVVPAPLQLAFKQPTGDCHIKAGYRINEELFVIKIATGFYERSTGDGIILIVSQKTGKIEAMLYDEGWLTQIRTALAACIAAELTPFKIDQIGIIGTGKQAEVCLNLLSQLYPMKKFAIWGRNFGSACSFADRMQKQNIDLRVDKSRLDLISSAQLIITVTASREPLLWANEVKAGTHIIALGADERGKQELDPAIFEKAKIIVVDSRAQASQFGDLSYAIDSGLVESDKIVELGEILQKQLQSCNTNDIMVTDLTGIAAQDIFLAEWIYEKLEPYPSDRLNFLKR